MLSGRSASKHQQLTSQRRLHRFSTSAWGVALSCALFGAGAVAAPPIAQASASPSTASLLETGTVTSPADPTYTHGWGWDFETGTDGWYIRNASDTSPQLTRVSPGAADTQYALRAENRGGQGDGPILDVQDILEPLRTYEVTGYARFIDRAAGTGQLTLSSQTGDDTFTNLLQDITVGNDWTAFSGEFTMPIFSDLANLYFETPWEGGAAGDTTTFEIDEIKIYTVAEDEIELASDLIPLRLTLPGIHTGVAVDSRELTGARAELVTHHFNKLVAENHMKPDSWWQGFGTNATFRLHPEARQILDFAQAHNMNVYGHVLVWHSQTPLWLFREDMDEVGSPELTNSPEDQEEMLRRMKWYIRLVAQTISDEYGLFGSDTNPINSYEVANEVVADTAIAASLNGGLRPDSPWTRLFNSDGTPETAQRFLREAFTYADQMFNGEFHVNGTVDNPAQGDDRITLWINDYNTERGGIGQPDSPNTKRFQLLQLVNNLIDAGVPIDGVGHQFHAGLEWDVNGLRDALDLFAYDNGWVHKPVLQAVTEIDVTIPGIGQDGVTEDQLLAQGDYYRQAFDIIREHQLQHGDIDTVTIWGLTDNRSWRADQLPLLFDIGLNEKPAFAGAVASHGLLGDAGMLPRPDGGVWRIPVLGAVAQSALVFGGSVPVTDASFDAPYWVQLPSHPLAGGAGSFHVRWSPGELTVLTAINNLQVNGSPTAVMVNVNGHEVEISQSGEILGGGGDVATGQVHAVTRVTGDSWQAVIQIPTEVQPGSAIEFNVARVTEAGAQAGAWSADAPGQLDILPEDLSYLQIPEADVRPVLDGDLDAVWAEAPVISTSKLVEGAADGATAEVRTLWYQGAPGSDQPFVTLYVYADVTDPTIDLTGAQDHEKDSVEVFVGLADRTGDPHQLYDAQFRVDADGVETFGQGDNNIQAQRVQSAVQRTATGYVVEMAIAMRTDTGHLQGQWNDGLAGLGTVHNFDVQVNDATNGVRTSVHTWADPTGSGWGSTARLGVAQLVEEVTHVAAAPPAATPPGVGVVTPAPMPAPTPITSLTPRSGMSNVLPVMLTALGILSAFACLAYRPRKHHKHHKHH